MNKLILFAFICTTLLAGCSLKEAKAKMSKENKQITHTKKTEATFTDDSVPEVGNRPIFQPKATISISPLTFESTNATITTEDLKENVSGIRYHIWRTADGPENMKTFTSTDTAEDFSFLFDTNEFSGKRGEYHVEAYSVQEDGVEKLLAKTTLTFQQHIPILMYHAIDDYKGVGMQELFVSPANFEEQMRYLKDHGYTFLTFENWREVNKVNKPVLVTFDDGMKNNLKAFWILQKLQDNTFHPAATEYVIAGSIDKNPSRLSSADIKEMADSGIFSIQSHTMSHADLPKITNYEEELEGSKEKIEQVTGKPVIAIAYPFGHVDSTVVEETKKYYQYATTTKPGQFIEKGEADEMLLMRRVRISNSTTINQFAALVHSW
ncbi:polysaccharide deacetylase [Bacillus sp. MUM 116]|uniref:polysaccharide deacetylase family protein n=1 Tax=Bacillus sp. MUM 116 TaxID=1678002 RepID=UPI0008F596C8|nr:polysaccharide deacetylase family protein [Bacillus sp. MUM 116]OIK15004.1 polysaccharide deacetylase [Bacillus sp. MUM 116]